MASPEFASSKEFRTVMDAIFTMMSDDPEMGPKLRDADVPQKFDFDYVELIVNVRAGADGEPNLAGEWSEGGATQHVGDELPGGGGHGTEPTSRFCPADPGPSGPDPVGRWFADGPPGPDHASCDPPSGEPRAW